MLANVKLTTPSREDIQRLAGWLEDSEVNASWYGLGEDGKPLHAGYTPAQVLEADQQEWDRVFNDENRRVFAVYTDDEEHIGEGQLVIDWPLQEAQVYILVGRKDMWHHHYGTTALVGLMDHAFNDLGLHRVWVDVPDYNQHAMQMVTQVGFVLEGHFRKAHRRDGEWFDSSALGLLADEFSRRRSRLMDAASP